MMLAAVGDHRCFALESQHVPCSKFEFVLPSHDALRFQNQVGLLSLIHISEPTRPY